MATENIIKPNAFLRLSERALGRLQDSGSLIKAASETTLMRSGDKIAEPDIYYILRGSVLVYVTFINSNDECVLDYLHEGDFVGELPLFANTHYRSATVMANEDCELLLVKCAQMKRLMDEDSEILMYLTHQLARRLHQTTQRLYSMNFHSAGERLMHFLLLSARNARPGLSLPASGGGKGAKAIDSITLKVTRREIGRTIGCARETAGRELKALEHKDYLRLEGSQIILVDPVRMITDNFEKSIARIWLD